jgi:hypothetical protein
VRVPPELRRLPVRDAAVARPDTRRRRVLPFDTDPKVVPSAIANFRQVFPVDDDDEDEAAG